MAEILPKSSNEREIKTLFAYLISFYFDSLEKCALGSHIFAQFMTVLKLKVTFIKGVENVNVKTNGPSDYCGKQTTSILSELTFSSCLESSQYLFSKKDSHKTRNKDVKVKCANCLLYSDTVLHSLADTFLISVP